jgi:hypothetical protein
MSKGSTSKRNSDALKGIRKNEKEEEEESTETPNEIYQRYQKRSSRVNEMQVEIWCSSIHSMPIIFIRNRTDVVLLVSFLNNRSVLYVEEINIILNQESELMNCESSVNWGTLL